MSLNTLKILNNVFSNPTWKLLLVVGLLAFIACFIVKGKKKAIPIVICVASIGIYSVTAGIAGRADRMIGRMAGQDPVRISDGREDKVEFSENTLFTLRVYEPWIYESLHYTLQNDGTLIVLYYSTELGREKLSEEKMKQIRKVFSPEKVYSMNIGKEDDRTDGTSRYIVLYDSDENQIEIGGYELKGGDHFNSYFDKLYELVQDDFTKQWSDKVDECIRDNTTYGERYLNTGN